jgi:hypothetical protein
MLTLFKRLLIKEINVNAKGDNGKNAFALNLASRNNRDGVVLILFMVLQFFLFQRS